MLVVWDAQRGSVAADHPLAGREGVPDPITQSLPPPASYVAWDASTRTLRAVRDRIGLTRVFYTDRGNDLILSDRVATLLANIPRTPDINLRSAVRHLCGVSAPLLGETFFEGIHEVPPGHVLVSSEGKIRIDPYWKLGRVPPLRLSSDAEYEEALREILFRVVADYLPPREVGLTLSSGLDSPLIAAAIAALGRGDDTIAFTWSTPGLPVADEYGDVAEVAAMVGVRLRSVLADHLWPLSDSLGLRPSSDSPIHNIFTEAWDEMFRQMVDSGIDSALTGLSGDHLFAGEIYGYTDLLVTFRWVRLARLLRNDGTDTGVRLRRLVRHLVLRPLIDALFVGQITRAGACPEWVRHPTGDVDTRLGPASRAFMLPGRWERHRVLSDPVLPIQTEFTTTRAASHGLRLVHPLLDHRLVEFAASLPASQTARGPEQKRIVRGAMRGRLPDVVLDRRGKRYPIALAHLGLREKEQAKVWHLLDEMRAADLGVVDPKRLRAHYQSYLDGDTDDLLFWNALTLEAWLRGLQ